MAEASTFTLLYWHWIVLGLLLITLELFAPLFVMLWLGIAAVVVGLVLSVTTIDFSTQLIIWAILSGIFLLLWHKLVSPRISDHTTAGLSREAIVGQVGMVSFFNQDEGRGKLKFPAPIVGNDEWEFIYDGSLSKGDKVKVVDISGNSLIIKPLSPA